MKLIWRGPQRWFSNYFIYCFSWRLKKTLLHFQVVSRDQNLTLPINDETIGKYYCHAETPGYASVTSRYVRPRNFGGQNRSFNWYFTYFLQVGRVTNDRHTENHQLCLAGGRYRRECSHQLRCYLDSRGRVCRMDLSQHCP